MIVRHYEAILRVECDCCCNEEFIPDDSDGEITEISIVWNQAENMGWKKLPEDDTDYHFCPSCVIKLFKQETEYDRQTTSKS
jgi:hypothetical protein